MTPSPRVLIDASNLHVGGGIQVATAFLTELLHPAQWDTFTEQHPWLLDCRISVSSEVRANLTETLPAEGRKRLARLEGDKRSRSHTRFTVFGPTYTRAKAFRHIMGFADVTSIYDWPHELPVRSLRQRVRKPLALLSFRRADVLVVETRAVKDRLVDLGFSASRVKVVANSCHPLFAAGGVWRPKQREQGEPYRLLYVARAYPHKNHEFLGHLGRQLELAHGLNVRFSVTLTDDEWSARTPLFRTYAENVGLKNVSHLPDMYLSADAVVFPSLLECFSASPLEAMALGVPLLASDRDFVHTACGDAATYFQPDDYVSAASVIAAALRDTEQRDARIATGLARMGNAPTSMDRTRAYLGLIHTMTSESP